MVTLGDRIRRARGKVSREKLAPIVGKSASTLRNWESGSNEPSEGDLFLFAQKVGVSYSWLTTGEGQMRGFGSDERQNAPKQSSPTSITYPVADGTVAAGERGGVQTNGGETMTLARDVVASWNSGQVPESDEAYWTRVCGTSMEPWLVDGTPIFVVRCDEVGADARYVIWMDDMEIEMVKRIQRLPGGVLHITSDHPESLQMQLEAMEEAEHFKEMKSGKTVRLRVRGRVVYPADTAHAILKTIMQVVGAK